MRFSLAVIGAVVASAVLGAQGRGVVTEVSATPTGDMGNVKFEARGNNPCGAVFLDFGDGTQGVTYAITQLPATMIKEYFQTGTFRVTARGMGNCDGSATTEVRVTRARPQPAPPPQPTCNGGIASGSPRSGWLPGSILRSPSSAGGKVPRSTAMP